MARMTLTEARAKAEQIDHALARLLTVANADPQYARNARQWEDARRRLARGAEHEVKELQRLVADLVTGLQGIGPARSGQIGGQRQGGHDTSAAALALAAPKAGTQRARVLDALRHDERRTLQRRPRFGADSVGLTDVELSHDTGLPPNSVRPRRVELVDAGWVEDSGRRRKHNGRDHVVWTLTEAARQTVIGTSTDNDRSTTA